MNQYFSILFLQSFNLPSEPLPLPQIENNVNLPSSGSGNEDNGTGSSSAGSGGWSGNDQAKQGAIDPLTTLMLPPKRPSANVKNVKIQRKRKQEATKTQTSQPIQEISVRENMMIGFYNIPFKDIEAYLLFFQSMGIQVSPESFYFHPRVTHVIARGQRTSNKVKIL